MINILYITNKDPRKCSHGNEQRTNALWNELKKYGVVYTLQILNNIKEGYVETIHPICFYAPNQHYKKPLYDFFYQLVERLTSVPYLPFTYPLYKEINNLFPHIKFDLVVIRYVFDFAKFHLWKAGPTIVDIDDHPAQLFDTMKQKRLPTLLRPLGKFLNRIQLFLIFKKISGGWISNQEQLKMCPSLIKYLPNIPQKPSEKYNPQEQDRKYLFSIGLMSYPPNYLGVDNFLNTIWPVFHRRFPHVNFIIGGKEAPSEYAYKWNCIDGVKYVGFIKDIESAYQHCIASVVTVETGGGTCIKTLESLAFSRVCLSTEFGARGVFKDEDPQTNGILLYRTANDFINYYDMLQNEQKRRNMEQCAFLYIESNFSNKKYQDSVRNVVSSYTSKK